MAKYTLTQKDLEILFEIELDADLEISQLSKNLSLSERSVAHSLSKLKQQLDLTYSPFIDISKIGFTWIGIFISFLGKADLKRKFINEILKIPSIGWLAELSGDYQLGLSFGVENIGSISEINERVLNLKNAAIINKSLVIRNVIADLSTKINDSQHFLRTSLTQVPLEIDRIDRQVLSALAHNWGGSYRKTALNAGFAISSFDLRVKKLRQSKVLIGSRFNFDQATLNLHSYKLLIYIRSSKANIRKRLFNFCLNSKDIDHYIECEGSWDFEINLRVSVQAKVGDIISELQNLFFPEILQIKALSINKVHYVNRLPWK